MGFSFLVFVFQTYLFAYDAIGRVIKIGCRQTSEMKKQNNTGNTLSRGRWQWFGTTRSLFYVSCLKKNECLLIRGRTCETKRRPEYSCLCRYMDESCPYKSGAHRLPACAQIIMGECCKSNDYYLPAGGYLPVTIVFTANGREEENLISMLYQKTGSGNHENK